VCREESGVPPLVCEKKEGTTRRNWFAGEDNVVMETSSFRVALQLNRIN